MRPRISKCACRPGNAFYQRGSVLIIVLWIAFGLVSITLYFANSMSFELRASDNRVSGLVADQAIAGAARYVSYVLSILETNGVIPDVTTYACEAVPVGEAHFWLVGRGDGQGTRGQVYFGLVDEASKLNLNTATAAMLEWLPRMTPQLAANIVDWHSTNGTVSPNGDGPTVYGRLRPPYLCKNGSFETVDELRLVSGATMDILVGEDANRNGALDPNEDDANRDGLLDAGVLEYVTVYSREPNTRSNGTQRVNLRVVSGSTGPLASLLQDTFGSARADQILTLLGLMSAGPTRPGGPGGNRPPVPTVTISTPLVFYVASGMTADEFAKIANDITVTNGAYIEGRVNVNTASAEVLACLPGIGTDKAPQLVSYRQTNPDKLTSVAWVLEALGLQGDASLRLARQLGDSITVQSYQFTADVAALGPYGRGYRRTRFVCDTSEGTPKIIHRQDLGHLGWALGKEVRQTWLVANNSR